MVPYVITLASATPPVEAIPTTSVLDMLWAGGPLLWPIGFCSFVLLLVSFERTVSLRRRRVAPKLFSERLLLKVSEGAVDREAALALCEKNNSHVAEVFAAAIRKWGKPAVEVEQAVLDEGERVAKPVAAFPASDQRRGHGEPAHGASRHGVGG